MAQALPRNTGTRCAPTAPPHGIILVFHRAAVRYNDAQRVPVFLPAMFVPHAGYSSTRLADVPFVSVTRRHYVGRVIGGCTSRIVSVRPVSCAALALTLSPSSFVSCCIVRVVRAVPTPAVRVVKQNPIRLSLISFASCEPATDPGTRHGFTASQHQNQGRRLCELRHRSNLQIAMMPRNNPTRVAKRPSEPTGPPRGP